MERALKFQEYQSRVNSELDSKGGTGKRKVHTPDLDANSAVLATIESAAYVQVGITRGAADAFAFSTGEATNSGANGFNRLVWDHLLSKLYAQRCTRSVAIRDRLDR